MHAVPTQIIIVTNPNAAVNPTPIHPTNSTYATIVKERYMKEATRRPLINSEHICRHHWMLTGTRRKRICLASFPLDHEPKPSIHRVRLKLITVTSRLHNASSPKKRTTLVAKNRRTDSRSYLVGVIALESSGLSRAGSTISWRTTEKVMEPPNIETAMTDARYFSHHVIYMLGFLVLLVPGLLVLLLIVADSPR